MDFEHLVKNVGNPKLIKEALQSDPSLALATDLKQGRTLLHFAAGHGIDEIVDLLINLGSDVNQKDFYEETPIFRAIRFRKESCVELLIKNGADLSVTDSKQQTPLHRACDMGTLSIIAMLIDGSDIDATDHQGRTALEVLESSSFTKKLYSKVEEMFQEKIDLEYCNKKLKLDNQVDISEKLENDFSTDQPVAKIEVDIDPETENDDEVITDVEDKNCGAVDEYWKCLDGHLVPSYDLKLIDDWLYTNDDPKIEKGPYLFYLKKYDLYIAYCRNHEDVEKLDDVAKNVILVSHEDCQQLDKNLPRVLDSFQFKKVSL